MCLKYVRSRDDEFQILVRDEGEGMSKGDLNISVTRFGQVSNKEQVQEGSGLGLPSSIGLVKAHGAILEISSAPQEGTLIIITLCEDDVWPETDVT